MLAARATETGERAARDIMPARNRDFLDRIRHIRDRDRQQTFGCRRRLDCASGGGFDLASQGCESGGDDLGVERLVAAGTEQRGEKFGAQPAERDIAVGHGQRAVVAITGRAGKGACRVRADLKACAVKAADRAAARRDGMDPHHWRDDPRACDDGFAVALEHARKMRDVGRSAPHVEADDLCQPGLCGGARHADNPARGPRKDGVAALKMRGIGQPAVRLHKQAADLGACGGGKAFDIAAQHR